MLARYGDVRRDAVLPCKQALRVRLPTSPLAALDSPNQTSAILW